MITTFQVDCAKSFSFLVGAYPKLLRRQNEYVVVAGSIFSPINTPIFYKPILGSTLQVARPGRAFEQVVKYISEAEEETMGDISGLCMTLDEANKVALLCRNSSLPISRSSEMAISGLKKKFPDIVLLRGGAQYNTNPFSRGSPEDEQEFLLTRRSLIKVVPLLSFLSYGAATSMFNKTIERLVWDYLRSPEGLKSQGVSLNDNTPVWISRAYFNPMGTGIPVQDRFYNEESRISAGGIDTLLHKARVYA